MSTVTKVTELMLENYTQLLSGNRSVRKANALTAIANTVLRAVKIQMHHVAPGKPIQIGFKNEIPALEAQIDPIQIVK